MSVVLAISPIAFAVFLILGLSQSAFRSGFLSLALAIAVAAIFPTFAGGLDSIVAGLVKGSLNTVGLAYVLLGGVVLYHVLARGGALDVISDWIGRLIPHPVHQVFVVVFGVSVFFESATGFGVGIIVTAPLLVALGYSPMRAAILALIGQCAVTWGALAVGTVLGAELSGVDAGRIGVLGAAFSFPYVIFSGIAAIFLSGHQRPLGYACRWLLIYALTLTTILALVSHIGGIELAGCIAGLGVFGVGVLAARRKERDGRNETRDLKQLAVALLPLAVLLFSLLSTRLIHPFGAWLRSFLVIELPDLNFNLPLAYHPGTLLLLASVVGIIVLTQARSNVTEVLLASFRQWCVAAFAVLGFLCLGQVMYTTGMTNTIAAWMIQFTGDYYALALPLIGGLGGFMTASNAASNALFMTLQMAASDQLGINREIAATAQNVAGSNMTLASPGRLVFAAAIAGIAGREAELMRRVLVLGLAGLLSVVLISYLTT